MIDGTTANINHLISASICVFNFHASIVQIPCRGALFDLFALAAATPCSQGRAVVTL